MTELNASQITSLLIKNLEGLDAGTVTVDRANAISRLGTTIFQGVRARLKVQTQAGMAVTQDLRDFAGAVAAK